MWIDAVNRRVSWLGRPWFFVAVVVLALNDHLFKGVCPGWVTEKLSDFAGLVVVATLAAVLAGPTRGTALTGGAFVALKTVPGVAEAIAPALGGGITLRDPTDLIALSVLPPLWWVLHRVPDPGRTRRAWIAVGLVAGVLATTATEAPPPEAVVDLGTSGDQIFAEVHLSDGYGDRWLKTADGGLTWTRTDAPANLRRSTEESSAGEDYDVTSWTACADDGVCYRATSGYARYSRRTTPMTATPTPPPKGTIERSTPWTSWTIVLRGEGSADFRGIAVQPGASAHVVALAANDRDVVSREIAGTWRRLNLVDLARDLGWVQSLFAFFGERSMVLLLGAMLSLLGWLLVPGLGGKIALQVLTVLSGIGNYVLWIAAYQVTRAYAYTAWFVALTALILMLWWVDRPRERDGTAPGDGARGHPGTTGSGS